MKKYERRVCLALQKWQMEMCQYRPSLLQQWSLQWQQKIDNLIPKKIHTAMANGVRIGISSFLQGLSLIPVGQKKLFGKYATLEKIDEVYVRTLDKYKTLSAAEGAGTGAGGLVLSAIDFPALISIKLKFLQEVAVLYGFDIKNITERVFLLKVFQLAYASPEHRRAVYEEVKSWDETSPKKRQTVAQSISWHDFYLDYKEHIEFRKMLQILPGIGAVIGAWANHSLLDELGETAQSAYRLRYLQRKYGINVLESEIGQST